MQTIADKKSIGYFKLATFCQISMTWKDGKKAFSTEADAIAAAKKPGQYRISHVQQNGRTDKEPFSK
jgi:hypothetical protein